MKKYLAYLMDYMPEGVRLNGRAVRKMMQEAHFCVSAPNGIAVGARVTVGDDALYIDEPEPKPGTRLRCVEHRHKGKVAVFVEDP